MLQCFLFCSLNRKRWGGNLTEHSNNTHLPKKGAHRNTQPCKNMCRLTLHTNTHTHTQHKRGWVTGLRGQWPKGRSGWKTLSGGNGSQASVDKLLFLSSVPPQIVLHCFAAPSSSTWRQMPWLTESTSLISAFAKHSH